MVLCSCDCSNGSNVSKSDLDGRSIEKLAQSKHLSTTRDTVFINRGSIDGVTEGPNFYVISQRWIIDKETKDIPLQSSGILVVHVEDDHSVAVDTDASRLLKSESNIYVCSIILKDSEKDVLYLK